MSLMDKMKVASDLQNMTIGEKFFGGIQVALFGIAVVFLALFLLFLIIAVLENLLHKAQAKNTSTALKEPAKPQNQVSQEEEEKAEDKEVDDGQLIAVITAVVAASLHTSTHNIVVRNVTRIPDTTPAWGKLGRIQQVNRME